MLPIAVSDFKARFNREWAYGTDPGSVQDADINNALSDADAFFNSALWESTSVAITAALFLTAHFLNANIKAAGGLSSTITGQGLTDTGDGPIESTGAGGVNVGWAVPEAAKNSPFLSPLLTSRFGQRYVAMFWPRSRGNAVVVAGWDDTGAPTGE